MIRILQIVSSMDRGGIETYIMNVYRKIDKSKIQFDFLVHTNRICAYDDEIEKLGGKIYRIHSRHQSIVQNRKDLNDFFKNHSEYKIVHMHESSLSYITPLKIAKKHGIPIRILHSRNNAIRGNKLHILLHHFNQFIFPKYITDCFAISDKAAIWMFGKKFYNSGKVKLLKNGINIENFKFNQQYRDEIRTLFNISNDKIVLGHVGRFSKQKNHAFLIDIFSEICKNNNNYMLLLIGDGNKKEEIKEIVSSKNLLDNVIFINPTYTVERYYAAMDLFILPSLFEGLGRVLIEAQCNGLMCFASQYVIPEEVAILDSFSFVPLKDGVDKWVQQIITADKKRSINSDQSIREAGYDMNEVTKELSVLYLNLLNRRC
ncbi:MAG: glycosyltransferase family 1 protein [Beduini sp.]|uniref:glycosyltransferase family 1 protein n=1 Tax=Beduini sp. TaxID=1922300 RepID=UPI0011CB0F42